jgi:hypothetical protein
MNHAWQRILVVMVLVVLFYFLFGANKTLELLLSLQRNEFNFCEEEECEYF